MQRVWVYLLLALGVGLFGRVAGPSDLYDNDQPKTVAYTVDMVKNGHWLLPRDMLGNPATKPPLFNWIGTVPLATFGPSELVLKLPSVIGALVVMGLTVMMGRRMSGGSGPVPALEVGVVAGLLWLASSVGMKHIYLARPDMVLAAALTGAWACATVCLRSQAPSRFTQAALWICIALAALAKGPPAILGVLFVVLGAKLLTGRWASVRRTGIAWGLPLAMLIVGGWVYAAYSADPAGFRAGMLSDTIEHRSTAGGFGPTLLVILADLWKMPIQFIARFLPWSIFAVLTLIHIPPRRWFASTLGPAILWVLLVIGFFMLSPRQRPDYLLPAFGPAAILAAYWLLVVGAKYRLTARKIGLAACGIIVGFCVYYWYFADAAQSQYGQNTIHFAAALKEIVRDDSLRVIDGGYNPLPALLGVNPPYPVDANWLIQPMANAGDQAPILISEPIPGVGKGAEPMGLFRAEPNP